jgi:type I restriction enzyme S subunit
VSNGDILNLVVPIPPLSLQNRFANFARQTDKSKFEMQQGLKQLELQYNALMQQYFG